MKTKPRGKLAEFIGEKKGTPDRADLADTTSASSEDPKEEQIKGYVIRFNVAAWRQLKILALEQNCTMSKLLLEAVNDLFKKYGKPPLA